MRCPRCNDGFEDHVTACPDCGVPLVRDGDPTTLGQPPVIDARLGVFHPVMAARILALLERRGIGHETLTGDAGVAIVVDRAYRDDLRTELTLTWADLVRRLDEDETAALGATGGSTPGWFDPPRGGHVDREGRLVVDTEEDAEQDAARVIGPSLVATGAILVVVGWVVLDAAAVTVAGIGLALLGLLMPR